MDMQKYTKEDLCNIEKYYEHFYEQMKEQFVKKQNIYNGAFFKSPSLHEAYEDVKRKYVRAASLLSAIDDGKLPEDTDDFLDTMLDQANYCMMTAVYLKMKLREEKNEEFKE